MKKIIILFIFLSSFLFAEIKFVFIDNVYDYDSTTKTFSSVCVDKSVSGNCSKTVSIDNYLRHTVCEDRKFDIKGFSAQYVNNQTYSFNKYYLQKTVIYRKQFIIEMLVDCIGKKKNKKNEEKNELKVNDTILKIKNKL